MADFSYKAKDYTFEKDPMKKTIGREIDKMDNENLWGGKAVNKHTRNFDAAPQKKSNKRKPDTKGPKYKPLDKQEYKKKVLDYKINKYRLEDPLRRRKV